MFKKKKNCRNIIVRRATNSDIYKDKKKKNQPTFGFIIIRLLSISIINVVFWLWAVWKIGSDSKTRVYIKGKKAYNFYVI